MIEYRHFIGSPMLYTFAVQMLNVAHVEMIGVVRFPVEGHIDILEFMSDYERDRLDPKRRGEERERLPRAAF